MSLKQLKILAFFLAVGILIFFTAARIFLDRADGPRFQLHTSGPAEFKPAQLPNFAQPEQWPGLISTQPKPLRTNENGSELTDSLPTTSETTLAHSPLTALPGESVEKEWYFEFMTEALEDDFSELNLSEIEKIELFETIWKIRSSFEQLRSLDRSAENVSVIHHLEFERNAAIADFEEIIGMGFYEFMLRTPPTEGGIDHD